MRGLRDTIIPIAKLEFLNPDGLGAAFEVVDDFIADGQLTVKYQNGQRRTATITIDNWKQLYNININKIWFGQQIRLFAGIVLHDGTECFLPQGVFYISNPDEAFEPSKKTVTLNLVDKWSFLDGSLFGKVDGIYQINVGTDMFAAVADLLRKDRGNGLPIDSIPPMFSSYFKHKFVTIEDGSSIPITEAPYTIRFDEGSSFADVLLELATMLVASIGYDCNGQLRIESTQTDVDDYSRPVLWEFSTEEKELFGIQFTNDMVNTYNDIRITGAVVNGIQVRGRATNTNPASDTNVSRIGYKTYQETKSKYSTYSQCNEYAKYNLKKKAQLGRTANISCSPIYHLQENCIVSVLLSDISKLPIRCLISGYSLPIGGTGAMTIDVSTLNEHDIYYNWLTANDLNVLCADIGALKVTYGSGPTTAALTNPYKIKEIPSGSTVLFSVVTGSGGGFSYTIHSAKLNGIPLPHNGVSCSFVMPEYESDIVFQLSATAGNDFSFTYTGSYTDTTLAIDGVTYRLLTFTSSGTFTPNATQITNGVLADVWVRGAGGGGNSSSKGKNGYDESEYAVKLTSGAITIGSGGAAGTQAGSNGGSTSVGSSISVAGGYGATSYNSSSEGSLSPVFGSITNTTNGAGGAINASGNSGICYIRIAKKTA